MGFQWDSNSVGFQKTKTWDSTWDSVQQSVGFQMGFRQSNGHICYPGYKEVFLATRPRRYLNRGVPLTTILALKFLKNVGNVFKVNYKRVE